MIYYTFAVYYLSTNSDLINKKLYYLLKMEKDTQPEPSVYDQKFAWIDSLLRNNFVLAEALALKQLHRCPDDPEPVLFLEMYIKKIKHKDISDKGIKTIQEEIKEVIIQNTEHEEAMKRIKEKLEESSDDSDDYITPESSEDEDKENRIANLTYRREVDQTYNALEDRDIMYESFLEEPDKKKTKKVTALNSKGFTKSKKRISYVNFDQKTTATKNSTKTTQKTSTTKTTSKKA